MKCVNCLNESEKLKKYCFYYGKRTEYSADFQGTHTQHSAKYQMVIEPICDYVCSNCISVKTKYYRTIQIVFLIIGLVSLSLFFLLGHYGYQGWKIFFIVVSALTLLPIGAMFHFTGSKKEIGDMIVANNYLSDVVQEGYDTWQRRNGKMENKFTPIRT